MAVSVRGWFQGQVAGVGTSISWPAGTAAGDFVLIHCGGSYSNNGPQGVGWAPAGHKSHGKVVTTADLAGPLVVNASHFKGAVFAACRGVGRTSSSNGLTVQEAGSYLWVETSRSATPIAPATYRQGNEFVDEGGYYQAQFAMASNAGWAAVPSMGSGTTSYSYELLPSAGPAAPILVSPAAGAVVDQTLAITLDWDHQSSFEATGYRVRLTYAGPTYRYLDAAGALQTTEQSITSAATSATIAAAALTAGTAYTWAVATRDQIGWSSYSTERALNPVAPPSITTLTVASPAEDLTPVVTWAATAGYGVLTAHQVWICGDADTDPTVAPLWTSGVLPNTVSPDTAPATTPWVRGQSLKAWLMVWETGGVSNLLSSAAFTVTWTPPTAPTVTTSSSVSPPTVSVSGVAAGRSVEVQVRRDGVNWEPLTTRTATGTTVTGIPAPLAATGSAVLVRARQATVIDGVPMRSDWSTTASITALPSACWWVDDVDRSTYLVAVIDEDAPRVAVQGVTTTYGLGASSARVDRTPPAGESGRTRFLTLTAAEKAALDAWLEGHDEFWIVFPPEDGLAVESRRVLRVGPITSERVLQRDVPERLTSVSWVEAG